MSLATDASITTAWCFEDEATPAVEEALDQVVEGNAVVPSWSWGRDRQRLPRTAADVRRGDAIRESRNSRSLAKPAGRLYIQIYYGGFGEQ